MCDVRCVNIVRLLLTQIFIFECMPDRYLFMFSGYLFISNSTNAYEDYLSSLISHRRKTDRISFHQSQL